jgi:hypothetical protein
MRRLQQANLKKLACIGEDKGPYSIGQVALGVLPVLEKKAVKLFKSLRSYEEAPILVPTTIFVTESIGTKIGAKVMTIKPPGLLFKAGSRALG